MMDLPVEHHDILILGAGLSGLNTAHVLREELPHRSFVMLEKRSVMGGTWTFFKYPGFRSDSYMSSFGFKWFPWKHSHKMAPASEIMKYIEEAAEEDGINKCIRYRHKVVGLEWRSEDHKWRVTVDANGTRKLYLANFVISCMGYYSYDKAMETVIPGLDTFNGQVVHPQWWPEDLDWSSKRIVIIGSGATAITVLPTLADKAEHVTMLQRSPSFVVSRSMYTGVDRFLRMLFPLSWVYWLTWYYDTIYEVVMIQLLLHFPQMARGYLTARAKEALPEDIDVNVHFNPKYNPFQQRLCMCPEGDFFQALNRNNCDVVTDTIKTVTHDGILLDSGRKLDADIIITATGLYFQLFDGLSPIVDGKPVHVGDKYSWRGCMIESLPNTGFIMGYVTQSWTPGADAMARIMVRILKRMEKSGATSVVPVIDRRKGMPRKLLVDATSSYFVKSAERIPKVTGQAPWYGRTNLAVDMWAKLFGSIEDGLQYTDISKDKTS